jgi:hypothetical protein
MTLIFNSEKDKKNSKMAHGMSNVKLADFLMATF